MADQEIPEIRAVVTRAEARAMGLKRFYTGEPCIAGHVAERYVACKECVSCRRTKDLARYAAIIAGRLPPKKRNREQEAASYVANHAKHLARQAEWRKANAEKLRVAKAAYRAANTKKAVALTNAWRAANPVSAKVNNHNRRARERNAPGSHSAEDILSLFRRQKGRCAYCLTSIKAGYQVDHVVALSRGGSNWPSNLALACSRCNTRKHAKSPIEFARTLGRLL